MHIKNDYFLLYHGKNANEIEDIELNLVLDEHHPILSLILTLKKDNFNKVVKLKKFQELLSCVYPRELTTLDELYPLQDAIFTYLNSDKSSYDVKNLINHIEYLNLQEILPLDNYKKLISLFEDSCPIKIKNTNKKTSADDNILFHEKKASLFKIIKQLDNLFSNELLKLELKSVENYLNSQTFSIGVTGVINSGKSTMLNALLGKEILGSSVVPETANLTIIKYGKPSAEVFYWNKDEWNNIVQTAQSVKSINAFVEETQEKFSAQLDNYIKKESFSETILVDTISNYTSVKLSNGKCNLVKYVDLYYDLGFLKDGIEIVDTPGLDDPVVKREEITKEYLSRCDVMLHLMNVSQSATAKDVEFIIDAILYQYISKILIVITHADTVSKKEIQEVISYTKFSIKEQLQRLNKSSRVNYILEHIDFIPISAKIALLHKSEPQKAKELTMSMEKTGFLELEEYLQSTLFGKSNNKSELIMRNSSEKLKDYIDREIHLYKYSLEVLSHSKTELKESLESKKEKHSNSLKLILEDMSIYKGDSVRYIRKLDTFLNEAFLDLSSVTRERLFLDVKYSYERDKKVPDSGRSKVILQTAIKDGVVDIIRDYRYKLTKTEKKYFLNYDKKLQNLKSIDIEYFFKNSFREGFLTFSTEIFSSKVLHAIQNSKSSKLELLKNELSSIIKEEIDIIYKYLHKKAFEEANRLIIGLFELASDNINAIKEQFEQEEILIQNRLDNYDNSKQNSIFIMQNIKELESIKAGLSI